MTACDKLLKEAFDNLHAYVAGILKSDLTNVPRTELDQDSLYRYQLNDIYSGPGNILKMKKDEELELLTPLSTSKTEEGMREFATYKIDGLIDSFGGEPEDYAGVYVYFKDSKGKSVIDVEKLAGTSLGHDEQEVIIPAGSKIKKIDSYKEGNTQVEVFKILGISGLMYLNIPQGGKEEP